MIEENFAVNFTLYKPTGEIRASGVAPMGQVEVNIQPGEAVIYEPSDSSRQYVVDGVIVNKPPKPSPHHVFDYAGRKWVDPRTLADLKAVSHSDIELWRDEQEAAGIVFEHAGRSWDGGLIVRQRLQPVLGLPALPPGFFWTDASNEDVPMTLPVLQDLSDAHEQALVVRGFEIHARQRSLKNALGAMTMEQLVGFVPGWLS